MKITYNFEINRIIDYIGDSQFVILQFPEGLIPYSVEISQNIEKLSNCIPIIFSDVVYGACNYDDISASLFGVDKYIHFGHSQLVKGGDIVPLYIPCQLIHIDTQLLLDNIQNHIITNNFHHVQFTTTAQTGDLTDYIIETLSLQSDLQIHRFQYQTLHRNEILGCTCLKFDDQVQAVYSIVDGLFHMEAVKISNSKNKLSVFRVDPRTCLIDAPQDIEYQGHLQSRLDYIKQCKVKCPSYKDIGIVFGSLGRQSSYQTLLNLINQYSNKYQFHIVVASEIFPNVCYINNMDIYVQMGCPRLTFDWGSSFFNMVSLFEFAQIIKISTDIEDYSLANFKGDVNSGEQISYADCWI